MFTASLELKSCEINLAATGSISRAVRVSHPSIRLYDVDERPLRKAGVRGGMALGRPSRPSEAGGGEGCYPS